MDVVQIKTSLIHTDPENRKSKGVSIIRSVETDGVLLPLYVRPFIEDGEYVVIAGNRRLASAKHFGLETVPCIIHTDDQDIEIIRGIENMDREPLSPLDESDQIVKMLQEGASRSEICGILNLSPWQLRRREKLQDLCAKAKDLLQDGTMSHDVALELSR